jgi:FkbM family methyltransferase
MDLGKLIYSIKEASNEQLRNDELFQFIGYCLTHAHQSESQNYQDVWALWESGHHGLIPGSFFVEFGATDGKTSSNTYMLEKNYKWNGILAEPNPVWHEALRKNRSCHITDKCVFSESGKTLEFLMTDTADLATIKGFGRDDEFKSEREKSKTITVETISLLDLLDEYKAPRVINYMSVDTEGSEYGILNSFFMQNKNKYNVKCISVEHNFTMRDKLHELMTANGYKRKFMEISRWDDFYVKEN